MQEKGADCSYPQTVARKTRLFYFQIYISSILSLSLNFKYILANYLMNFVTYKSIIIPEQFGFMPKPTTKHKLWRVIEVPQEINKNRVWYFGLIYKLSFSKIPPQLIVIFWNYHSVKVSKPILTSLIIKAAKTKESLASTSCLTYILMIYSHHPLSIICE